MLITNFLLCSTIYAVEEHKVFITNRTSETIPHVRIKVEKDGWNNNYNYQERCYGSVHIYKLKPGKTGSVILEKATKRDRILVLYPFRDYSQKGGKKKNNWSPLGPLLSDAKVVPLGIIVDAASGCPGGCMVTRKGKCAEMHDNAEYRIGDHPPTNRYEVIRENGKVVVRPLK